MSFLSDNPTLVTSINNLRHIADSLKALSASKYIAAANEIYSLASIIDDQRTKDIDTYQKYLTNLRNSANQLADSINANPSLSLNADCGLHYIIEQLTRKIEDLPK